MHTDQRLSCRKQQQAAFTSFPLCLPALPRSPICISLLPLSPCSMLRHMPPLPPLEALAHHYLPALPLTLTHPTPSVPFAACCAACPPCPPWRLPFLRPFSTLLLLPPTLPLHSVLRCTPPPALPGGSGPRPRPLSSYASPALPPLSHLQCAAPHAAPALPGGSGPRQRGPG